MSEASRPRDAVVPEYSGDVDVEVVVVDNGARRDLCGRLSPGSRTRGLPQAGS